MKRICNAKITVGLLVGIACLLFGNALVAQEEGDDPMLDMVVDLLHDPDPDMRVLGFQQVRDDLPGEAATKRLAAALPDLPPEVRAELLAALGDRGDVAAKEAVLGCLTDEAAEVQGAAMRALGALGNADDVPTLVAEAALDDGGHAAAACDGLVRLRGDGVDQAIADSLADATMEVSVKLLGVLAAREATDVVPAVVAMSEDSRVEVRIAALQTLRALADENQAAALVKVLKAAEGAKEQQRAQLALLTVCRSGSETCVDAILAGLADAEPEKQIALMHALARAGGEKALGEIVSRLDDANQPVADEALRLLSIWPDAAAIDPLRAVAEDGDNLREKVLAIRGLVSLGGAAGDKPAEVELLTDAMALAQRTEEKRLAVGALGNAATAEALAVTAPLMDDSEAGLVDEAALATVAIAERIMANGGEKASVQTALNKVVRVAKDQGARQRARVILDAP